MRVDIDYREPPAQAWARYELWVATSCGNSPEFRCVINVDPINVDEIGELIYSSYRPELHSRSEFARFTETPIACFKGAFGPACRATVGENCTLLHLLQKWAPVGLRRTAGPSTSWGALAGVVHPIVSDSIAVVI